MWVHSPAMLEKPRGMFGAHWLVDLSVISNDDWPASICFLPTHGKNRSAPRKWPMSHKPPLSLRKTIVCSEWMKYTRFIQTADCTFISTHMLCLYVEKKSQYAYENAIFILHRAEFFVADKPTSPFSREQRAQSLTTKDSETLPACQQRSARAVWYTKERRSL